MTEKERREIEQVCVRLAAQFPELPATTIRSTVDEIHSAMSGPIRDFVPILVERRSRDRLRTLSKAGRPGKLTA